jgi:hypothetical protein
MPIIGSNPYDVGNTFGGVGDMLGSAILRGAMMRQQAAQRQQDLMLEIRRLQLESERGEREAESARSLDKYRTAETGFREKESNIAERKQKQSEDEDMARRMFARSQRVKGLPPLPEDFGAPTMKGTQDYEAQKRMAEEQEGIARLSVDPNKAVDTINSLIAQRALGSNPLLQAIQATGMGLHNIPTGASAVGPLAGPTVAEGPPRVIPGQTLSPNVAGNMLEKLLTGGSFATQDAAMQDPMVVGLRNLILHSLGTNVPPSEAQGTVNRPKTKPEYDALPSGSIYIDTDGQTKRKK